MVDERLKPCVLAAPAAPKRGASPRTGFAPGGKGPQALLAGTPARVSNVGRRALLLRRDHRLCPGPPVCRAVHAIHRCCRTPVARFTAPPSPSLPPDVPRTLPRSAVIGGWPAAAGSDRPDRVGSSRPVNRVATIRCHPRARPKRQRGSPQRERSRGQCAPALGLRSFQ